LYYPIYPSEEFETIKSAAFMPLACFSLFIIDWKQILTDRIAKLLALFLISASLSTIYSIDTHMSIFGNPKLGNGLLLSFSYLIFYLCISKKGFEYFEYKVL